MRHSAGVQNWQCGKSNKPPATEKPIIIHGVTSVARGNHPLRLNPNLSLCMCVCVFVNMLSTSKQQPIIMNPMLLLFLLHSMLRMYSQRLPVPPLCWSFTGDGIINVKVGFYKIYVLWLSFFSFLRFLSNCVLEPSTSLPAPVVVSEINA